MLSDQDIDYEISLFDVIELQRIKTDDKPTLETQYPTGRQNEDINTGDFKYIIDSQYQFFDDKQELLSQLYSYLTKLEVSSTNHRVNNISYSSFIYALKQSNQINEDVINKMNCRALSKFLTIRDISRLADEFDLSCEVIYYYDVTTRNQRVILNRLSSSHNKQIIIRCWKYHYIISEITSFYDAYFDLNLRYKSHKPLQLTSVNLLMSLMTSL
jgi:ribosomal protein L20